MNIDAPAVGERRSARDRLLAAADELFHAEGIHTVGIDRVIERAGVAKASLYDTFGSKDALIRAYLVAKQEARVARTEARIAAASTPRDRLLCIFDLIGEIAVERDFRGCAFVRASAEAKPGSCVKGVCDDARAWLRARFVALSRDAGVAYPETLTGQLVLLYDGAAVAAQLDRDPDAGTRARQVAALMLDAALAPR